MAGRRLDASKTQTVSFPSRSVDRVASDIAKLFDQLEVTMVVASAACGADVLALEAALLRGAEVRVVLPLGNEAFRSMSVTDRAPMWGQRYDRLIRYADAHGAIVAVPGDGVDAFVNASRKILQLALTEGKALDAEAVAVAIWNLEPRAADDLTALFLDDARALGLASYSIDTR